MGLATDTGLLVTTERGVGRVHVVAVGPDATGLDATTHAVGTVDVAGPEAGTQAELGVVGDRQGFGFGLEGGDADHRAEDFFLEDAHLVVAFEQGRLDVVAVAELGVQTLGAATDQELGTLFAGDFHVGQDLVELLLGSLCADLGFSIQRVAALDAAGTLQNHADKVVVHVFLNQRAGRAGAHFALVEERQHHAFNGLADEGLFRLHDVGEVDVRRLAAQLDGRRDDVFRSALEDVTANRGRTGERQLGDAGAGGQRFTGFAAVAVNHVQHARRQQVADDFHQHQNAQRGLLGRLEHDAVTSRQRGGQFPRGHQQREVPRNDLTNDAQRLVEVVGRGVLVQLGSGAFLRAQAAGEVAEVVSRQRDVGVQGFAYGFAVVPGFGDGQQFEVLLDAVGDFQQDVAARLHGGLAPGIFGSVSGVQRLVDVFCGGARDFTHSVAGDRRQVSEVLAFDRCDKLAVDVVAIARLEGND